LVVGSPAADAAGTTTIPVPVSMSGSTTSNELNVGLGAVAPLPPDINTAVSIAAEVAGWGGGQYGVGLSAADVQFKTEFTQASMIESTFSDANLTEGQTLDVSDTATPITGSVKVTAYVDGDAGLFKLTGINEWTPKWTDSFTKTIDVGTALCTMPLPGDPPKSCNLPNVDFDIFGLHIVPLILGFELSYVLNTELEVDATGMVTAREYHVLPTGSDNADLSFPTPTIDDPYDLECSTGGNELTETLDDTTLSIAPSVPATLQAVVQFTAFPDTPGESTLDQWVLASKNLGELEFPDAQLVDEDAHEVSLGTVADDITPPTITTGSSFSGNEGAPITFLAVVQDTCLAGDIVWTFSDGTSEYGPIVQKAFNDDGPKTGKVVATDANGNKTTKTFTVAVANVAPNGNAGPDDSALWGVPVAFHGSAVDPSSADQGNLHYSWSFGDGSPSANGGPNTTHVYSHEGTYTATLSVCDDDGACDPTEDTRTINVSKRATTLAYTGAVSGLPKKSAVVSASVADELGLPVPGRTVKFTVGADTVSATTGSNGIATAALKINGKSGKTTLTAQLMLPATEKRYTGSSETVSFTIGK
jgi:hypothetical protein